MRWIFKLIPFPWLHYSGIGVVLFLAGCGHREQPIESSKRPAATVRTQVVRQEDRIATEEVVGTVRPKLSAVIAAKMSGTIEKLLAVSGQQVKKGELLAQLDAREIQARLDQALAIREQTKSDIDRFTKLLASQTVSQQEFDGVQARQRVAQAAAAEAETMLSYSKIIAPFDGVITRKYADVGDLATPGKPLFEMENPQSLRLEADVPEASMSRLKLNATLQVRIPSLSTNLEGTISEIAPAADPNSRTFLVKLDLPTAAGLRSGQFGRVAIPVADVTALRVPSGAVVLRGQMEIVFVVTNQQAQLRLIKTGKNLGNAYELLSGVSAGEQVVVEGAGELFDGQAVVIKP